MFVSSNTVLLLFLETYSETFFFLLSSFQFGRSQSYRVATTPLVNDGATKKDGGKTGKKVSKRKAKKLEKKENLEDLKKELEIVSRSITVWPLLSVNRSSRS